MPPEEGDHQDGALSFGTIPRPVPLVGLVVVVGNVLAFVPTPLLLLLFLRARVAAVTSVSVRTHGADRSSACIVVAPVAPG